MTFEEYLLSLKKRYEKEWSLCRAGTVQRAKANARLDILDIVIARAKEAKDRTIKELIKCYEDDDDDRTMTEIIEQNIGKLEKVKP